MIDFELRPTSKLETQRMVYEAARDFATQFIKPNVMEQDEAQCFPFLIKRALGSWECLYQKFWSFRYGLSYGDTNRNNINIDLL